VQSVADSPASPGTHPAMSATGLRLSSILCSTHTRSRAYSQTHAIGVTWGLSGMLQGEKALDTIQSMSSHPKYTVSALG
jgi:hypothetical protein